MGVINLDSINGMMIEKDSHITKSNCFSIELNLIAMVKFFRLFRGLFQTHLPPSFVNETKPISNRIRNIKSKIGEPKPSPENVFNVYIMLRKSGSVIQKPALTSHFIRFLSINANGNSAMMIPAKVIKNLILFNLYFPQKKTKKNTCEAIMIRP